MSDDRRAGPDIAPPATGPRPLGALADLAELLGGDTQRSRRFLGGVIAGALVGAAVAGGMLLRSRASNADDDHSSRG